MSDHTVRIYGDPCLRRESEPVSDFDESLQAFIREMSEIMYASRGVGLAAPQVGRNVRLFLMDTDWVEYEGGQESGNRRLRAFVNPEIVWESPDDTSMTEGCLSLPGIEAEVYRPAVVGVRWQDEHGETHEAEMTKLEARCFQHELDHLNGKLFVDRVPFVRRQLLAGKLRALKRGRMPA